MVLKDAELDATGSSSSVEYEESPQATKLKPKLLKTFLKSKISSVFHDFFIYYFSFHIIGIFCWKNILFGTKNRNVLH